ncbi:MAG: addiction module protein [Planctomycetales bacterium]|nr:addiction module protein [Planctomycetales bacterium]
MSLQSMISGLSHAEKLEAMDLLWRELSRVPSDYVSPEWHERILANRGANPEPGKPLPLNEARSEVKERLNARRTQG